MPGHSPKPKTGTKAAPVPGIRQWNGQGKVTQSQEYRILGSFAVQRFIAFIAVSFWGGEGYHQELPSRGCLLNGPLHLEELATSAFSPATECEASKAFAVLKDQSHSARYALEALLGT